MKTLLMIINYCNDWKWILSICKFAVYYPPPPCHGVALVSLSFRCRAPLSTDCIKVKRRGVLFCRLKKVPDCHLRDCLTSNRARSAKYNLRNWALLNFCLILFVQKSSQSSKNSFNKIQIFEFTNCTLPLFYSLLQIFEFTNSTLPLFYYLFRLSIARRNLTVMILDMLISVTFIRFAFCPVFIRQTCEP